MTVFSCMGSRESMLLYQWVKLKLNIAHIVVSELRIQSAQSAMQRIHPKGKLAFVYLEQTEVSG